VIDLVVVNYKTPDDLLGFVESVRDLGPRFSDYTLTVIDVEASRSYTDDLPISAHGTCIGVTSNIGYARACNHGAALGSSEYIGFFNADTALREKGTIEAIVETMDANPFWGVVGPRQVSSANKITHAGIIGTQAHPQIRGWQERDRGQYSDIEEVVSVAGSAYFVRRAAWEDLTECPRYQQALTELDLRDGYDGAFLPTRHYYEETWCSYHAAEHGWKVVYFGEATMTHEWHKASPVGGWAEQQMKHSQRLFRRACAIHGIDCD
jgi:GT2 family glycosyltransferase